MKPVTQTIMGRGPALGEPAGNCFAACIASILELPLEDVPNFCSDDNWRAATNAWLSKRGLFYVDVTIPEDFAELAGWGYHVISGDGPRGCRHSVVGLAGQMVHDPHPSRAGLASGPREFGLLVLREPAALVASLLARGESAA